MDQLIGLRGVSNRKMFGEYALYYKDKVVALISDDRLYVKPTKVGEGYIGEVTKALPYPGAKLCFLIEDRIEDKEWLQGLIIATESELPMKMKKKGNGNPQKRVRRL
jgi:TfoX/Sxy family transcriptional regulator of competence genes